MTHILSGEGFGQSKESLKNAIIFAIRDAMGAAGVNGDHINSITVIVDGYDYDGEKYNVKVSISVLDFDMQREDIYHERSKELQERLENSEDMAQAFYSSSYGYDYGEGYDRGYNAEDPMEDLLENDADVIPDGDGNEDKRFTFIASPEVHDQLGHEIMAERKQAALKTDAPSLDLGGGGGGSQSDDANEEA